MKFLIILYNFFLLSFPVNANTFTGEYSLIKGPKNCPDGEIHIKDNRLMFGTRHIWMIGEADKGESKETVEGGCGYLTSYEKNSSKILIKTIRSSCPNKSENAVVLEELQLANNNLTYSFKSDSDNKTTNSFKCEYKKSAAK